MRVLAIETSGEACSVALFDGDTLIARDHRLIGRGHAEMLVPMIAALPNKGRAERILVSLGPGSFTGVRIGIATARALGVAWQAEILGFPALALIAAMALAENEARTTQAFTTQVRTTQGVTVCINGGHGEWFLQNFTPNGLPEGQASSFTPEIAGENTKHQLLAGNKSRELSDYFTVKTHSSLNIVGDASKVDLLNDDLMIRDVAPIYGRAPDAKPQKVPAN